MLTYDCALCTRSGQRAAEATRCKCACPACKDAPPVVCPTCRGMWNRVFGITSCQTCSASGRVPAPCDACRMTRHDAHCSRCCGTGVLTCRPCGGTGKVDVHLALIAARPVENSFFTGMRARERSWNQGPLTELDPTEVRRAIAAWAADRQPAVYMNAVELCLADGHLMLTVHKVGPESYVLHHSTGSEDTDYGKEFRGPTAEPQTPAPTRPGRAAAADRPNLVRAQTAAAR